MILFYMPKVSRTRFSEDQITKLKKYLEEKFRKQHFCGNLKSCDIYTIEAPVFFVNLETNQLNVTVPTFFHYFKATTDLGIEVSRNSTKGIPPDAVQGKIYWIEGQGSIKIFSKIFLFFFLIFAEPWKRQRRFPLRKSKPGD